jgi:CheY-like chemotaxis protein
MEPWECEAVATRSRLARMACDMATNHSMLIVEDHPIEREGLGAILRAEGYDVSLASNGRDALRHLRDTSPPPDLILLDMMMPVIDGWHFLEKITELKLAPKPHIIVTTGNGSIGKDWVVAHGCSAVVRKPIVIEALLAEVRQVLATPS